MPDSPSRNLLREALVVVLASAIMSLASAFIAVRVIEQQQREQDRRIEALEEGRNAIIANVADIARDVGYIRGRMEAVK